VGSTGCWGGDGEYGAWTAWAWKERENRADAHGWVMRYVAYMLRELSNSILEPDNMCCLIFARRFLERWWSVNGGCVSSKVRCFRACAVSSRR
jgi:hypothetical protein